MLYLSGQIIRITQRTNLDLCQTYSLTIAFHSFRFLPRLSMPKKGHGDLQKDKTYHIKIKLKTFLKYESLKGENLMEKFCL